MHRTFFLTECEKCNNHIAEVDIRVVDEGYERFYVCKSCMSEGVNENV